MYIEIHMYTNFSLINTKGSFQNTLRAEGCPELRGQLFGSTTYTTPFQTSQQKSLSGEGAKKEAFLLNTFLLNVYIQ